jgi:hypothetical protein
LLIISTYMRHELIISKILASIKGESLDQRRIATSKENRYIKGESLDLSKIVASAN